MHGEYPHTTRCLTHQLDEDCPSEVGFVCRLCKERLSAAPPAGRPMTFWESQPAAYSAEGDPCFVYTIMWDAFRIRSLHPPECDEAARRREARADALEIALEWIETQCRTFAELRDMGMG